MFGNNLFSTLVHHVHGTRVKWFVRLFGLRTVVCFLGFTQAMGRFLRHELIASGSTWLNIIREPFG